MIIRYFLQQGPKHTQQVSVKIFTCYLILGVESMGSRTNRVNSSHERFEPMK